VDADPAPEEQAAFEQEMAETLSVVRRGAGCNLCAETGFLGRVGIFELLTMNEDIRRLILAGAPASAIRQRAIDDGMIAMRRDGMQKAKAGLVTPAEVMRGVYSIT
jgi:general secretion pathway protein E